MDSEWLQRNLTKAKAKQAAHEPIREQAELLRQKLIDELGVEDVRWACGWGYTPFRACLRSFCRLIDSHEMDFNLEGEDGVYFD